MKRFLLVLNCATLMGVSLLAVQTLSAESVTFGSGPNQFVIEFVTIGSPGNRPDTNNPILAGAVPYTFDMGKYEVSRDIITKANAAGSLDIPLGDIFEVEMRADMPATGMNWYEAARFVNWLNTSSGFSAAYKFDANDSFQLWQPGDPGFNSANPFRNTLARYVLPNVDEWYKAGHYDPTNDQYFEYPTGSDTIPTAVTSGTTEGTAVYDHLLEQGPADVMQAGGLSPFGTMAQGGNAQEWHETEYDRVNDSVDSIRSYQGGYWGDYFELLSGSLRFAADPSSPSNAVGFRVARVPEPNSLCLATIGVAGLFAWRRRRFEYSSR